MGDMRICSRPAYLTKRVKGIATAKRDGERLLEGRWRRALSERHGIRRAQNQLCSRWMHSSSAPNSTTGLYLHKPYPQRHKRPGMTNPRILRRAEVNYAWKSQS